MNRPGKKRRWTDEQLAEAVKKSRSYHQVFVNLGLRVGGGAHVAMRQRIEALGLDTSHFLGQGWNKGDHSGHLARVAPKRPLEEVLVRDSDYHCTNSLKRRLLRLGLLENKCYECHAPPEWRGKPLAHRLDHVNGDRTDNRIENLRLLCPNCDSQTPTFAGRNKARAPPTQ